MCLGIPGRIVRRWVREDGAILAEADFAGELRVIGLNMMPELDVGDYTLAHAGFALVRMSEAEAEQTVALMRSTGVLEPVGPVDTVGPVG